MMNSWKRSEKWPLSIGPVVGRDLLDPPRDPVARRRSGDVARQRDHPHRVAGGGRQRTTPATNRAPVASDQTRMRAEGAPGRAAGRRRPGDEGVADHLQGDVRDREQQGAVAERLRDRDRHQQAGEHHDQQHDADRRAVRVERSWSSTSCSSSPTTRRAAGTAVCERPGPGQVIQQQVRQLRDREHEDQVEEQLERWSRAAPRPPAGRGSAALRTARRARPNVSPRARGRPRRGSVRAAAARYDTRA